MKEQNKHIIDKISSQVIHMLQEELDRRMNYHDIVHTREVAEAAEKLAHAADVHDDRREILLLAAWLHDIGYLRTYEDHESASAVMAREILTEHGYPEEKTDEVCDLILSTARDAPKKGQLAELLHDADLSHMGRKRFFRKGELLRSELENMMGVKYSELDWQEKQNEFLSQNDFMTPEAKKLYADRRADNIIRQRDNIVKARRAVTRKKTGKEFGRGIDTLYRTNYRNHINFSSIADGKANMMISINTILISVIVTLSGASLSLDSFTIERFRYIIPILILLVGSLASVLFAILSARPKVTAREVDMEDVDSNKISLLYFGNFLGIPKEEFINYLSDLKNDQQRLYDSMSIDLYNLGIVLREKYRLLSVSYNLFMAGLSLSVIAFIVIFIATQGF